MKHQDLLVYLSGPITATDGRTVEGNVASALRVYLACTARGIPAICPQLSAAFPSAWQIPYETWMAVDLALVSRCTHLLLLPGWETSAGAVREKAHAERQGVIVVTSLEQVTAVAA